MSKATVTRLFVGSLIAVGAGAILGIAAVALAIANHVFVTAGSEIVGLQGGAFAWSLIGLGIAGGIVIMSGLIAGLVAWIGALLNTWQLDSRTWFAVLLLTGIFNFGFIAMVAFVIAGPDGRALSAWRTAPSPAAA
jgi:hypothetical protein